MKKIISLFQRNYDGDRLVRDEVVPGAEWVLAGEGVATQKYDGVCTLLRDGKLFKRYELKPGKQAPPQWEAADEVDETTGKQMGWIPVGDGPEDKYMREALYNSQDALALTGGLQGEYTAEFLGPKSQGNVEGYPDHRLLLHDFAKQLAPIPRTFEGIKAYLEENADYEGIVWHHLDGRMVKIKGKDFGIKRTRRKE